MKTYSFSSGARPVHSIGSGEDARLLIWFNNAGDKGFGAASMGVAGNEDMIGKNFSGGRYYIRKIDTGMKGTAIEEAIVSSLDAECE